MGWDGKRVKRRYVMTVGRRHLGIFATGNLRVFGYTPFRWSMAFCIGLGNWGLGVQRHIIKHASLQSDFALA